MAAGGRIESSWLRSEVVDHAGSGLGPVQRSRRSLHGVDAATIHAIAEAAGVQRSTVYNHWADRLSLIVDAIEDFATDPALRLTDDATAGTALDHARALVSGLGRNLRGDWGAIASDLAAAAERDPALANAHRDFVQSRRNDVERLLGNAIDDGDLDTSVDPTWATALLVGPLYYERLVMHRPMTDADVTRHIDRTLHLLGAMPPAAVRATTGSVEF